MSGCPYCKGRGWLADCFESTCVCLNPPCSRIRCSCNHDGRRPYPALHKSHGATPQTKPPGPLLEMMERKP